MTEQERLIRVFEKLTSDNPEPRVFWARVSAIASAAFAKLEADIQIGDFVMPGNGGGDVVQRIIIAKQDNPSTTRVEMYDQIAAVVTEEQPTPEPAHAFLN